MKGMSLQERPEIEEILQAISKKSFGPNAVLDSNSKSSTYFSMPAVRNLNPP